jgi:hypothetical protein
MDMACIMRPIDAHATGFFSSGIIERNGFEAAAERLSSWRSCRSYGPTARFGFEFDRNENIDKHLQWFSLEFGVPGRSPPEPLAGTQTHAVTL